MRFGPRLTLATAGLALALGPAGCAGTQGTEGGPGERTTLTVFAAASLQAPFEELGEQFEAEHEGVDVEFSFAGSSTLAEQIRQGAPADVFAAADTENMGKLVESDLQAGDPVAFTSNALMIAVPAGNPAGITDLASLTEAGVHLVVCAPEVPCGAAAETVEDSAGLQFAPVSEEQSVTDVLNKVTSGEADAGLVYVTDVKKAGEGVEGLELPESASALNTYPITTVKDSAHPELGQEFTDLVTSGAGQEILAEHGFAGL